MVLVCLVLGFDAGEAVDAAVAEPVAGAFEGEDVGVVDGLTVVVTPSMVPWLSTVRSMNSWGAPVAPMRVNAPVVTLTLYREL